MSSFIASGDQRVESLPWVFLKSIQGWFPLGLTGLTSMLSKGLSRVFSSTTVQKHQFIGAQPSLWSAFHICTWLVEKPHLWLCGPLSEKWRLCFLIHCLGLLYLSSKERASFNFMAEVTIHSDFGAQENKVYHSFHFFPSYLLWSDGTRCHDFHFLNAEFQASFFTLLFHPHPEALQGSIFCY